MHVYSEFPLSLRDLEGFKAGPGEITMYKDGVRVGESLYINFREVAE